MHNLILEIPYINILQHNFYYKCNYTYIFCHNCKLLLNYEYSLYAYIIYISVDSTWTHRSGAPSFGHSDGSQRGSV